MISALVGAVGAPVGAGVQYVGAPVVGVEDGRGVGALGAGVGDTVGSGVGMPVGAGVGQLSICTTPHDVHSHGVLENAS